MITYVTGELVHPALVAERVIVPVISVLPEFVAVKDGMLVFPLAPKPMPVLELVQETEDDDGVTETDVAATVDPIQANWSLIGLITGVG